MLKECMEVGSGEVTVVQEVKELGTLKTRSGRQVGKRKGRGNLYPLSCRSFTCDKLY